MNAWSRDSLLGSCVSGNKYTTNVSGSKSTLSTTHSMCSGLLADKHAYKDILYQVSMAKRRGISKLKV